MKILNNLRNLFQRRFYNRLMLYSTLIFIVVTYVLATVASNYSMRLEFIKQQRLNRDALNSLCSAYDRKHDEFYNLVLAIYEDQENYMSLTRLMESADDQPYLYDPLVKRDLTKVMKSIIVRDNDIEGLLIYKNLTDALFLYNSKSRTIESKGPEYPFYDQFREKVIGRRIYGTRTIDTSPNLVRVYGISGTLSTLNMRQRAGSILVMYNVLPLERALQGYLNKIQGRFLIVSTDGEIIYDSEAQYGKGLLPNMKAILSGSETAMVDGAQYYVQTTPRLNRNYIGVHMLRVNETTKNITDYPFFIFIIFTVMAIVSTLLYLISGSLVSRRIRELDKAMKRIGANNLSYRIPLHNRRDEFEEIASRFNEMCDELQVTIDREYVSEINKKNAELTALQAGINPHFLYNTLEAIRVKAYDDGNTDVAEMIVLLANLYRGIVHDRTFIPIHHEIRVCSMYISVFSLRYVSKLDCKLDIEPQIMEYGIPKNLLQPVVENYFVHGIREDCEDSKLTVRGWLEGGDICFSFEDNGRGMDENRLKEIRNRLLTLDHDANSSYGLSNVHERIKLVYGEQYGLRIDSVENSRTVIHIRIKAMTCDELNNYMGRKSQDIQED